MDEQLLNKDFKNAIASAELLEGKSKEGNVYYYLNLKFVNGYAKRLFVNNEVAFALKDALACVSRSSSSSSSSSDKDNKGFWD